MDTKNIYIIFREIDEIAAVFNDLDQVERYVNLHKKYFPNVSIDYIYVHQNLRMCNFYPVREHHWAGIQRAARRTPLKSPSQKSPFSFPEEEFDGYILLLEGFQQTIIGIFEDLQSADIFSDEYLAVFPHHVIVFFKYREGDVFQNIWEEENGKIKFLF
ncbi:MAG: hypothetical protein Q4A03_05195 [Rothia sp. (in: high G+C Gram-positive bacteria)]|uniref:hypothetical protein n=1 Tax=Rothia sp. (in: high G+C Gram-positive bacteria) TaxID=1885016 RepID=UPI0026F7C2FD|nr:hypothetical protein [Rothia sp. (in: high G+C Gram-positive bacteria)]